MEQKSLTLRECLIGDRTFYRHVAVVVLPIIVQNTLSNVVSLLDNVMVGQVGTLPMSAVAIINQLLFVFNLCIWGALAGAGIFGAQYYGQGNMEGVRQTLRMKLLIAVGLLVIAFGVLLGAGRPLIELYISADTTAADAAADQNIHALLGKKACQCAVAGSVGSNHFAGNHLIVFYFVNLKILCFSKMLKNIPVIVCNCNFHLTKSSVVFSYASFSCIKASIWSGSRIRFSERTSHPSSVIRISSSIRIPISHSSI